MAERRVRDPAPGDDAFARAVAALRPALKLHCYRMLGSLQESEDAVQETLAAAWAALGEFERRASLKAWLYRIATNVCLNLMKARARRRRYLPEQLGRPSEGLKDTGIDADFPWLQPYPDAEIDAIADPAPGPLARYEARESIRLAFVATVQRLPPRQRVALLFVDVMGWTVAEVATVLGASAASINSALQRARRTMRAHEAVEVGVVAKDIERTLAERYAQAWESRDLDGFVALLREDAVYAMPPRPQWYAGRDSIGRFFAEVWPMFAGFRLIATRANGSPAFAHYVTSRIDPVPRLHTLHVLTIAGDRIGAVHAFMQPIATALAPSFGLPATLDGRTNV